MKSTAPSPELGVRRRATGWFPAFQAADLTGTMGWIASVMPTAKRGCLRRFAAECRECDRRRFDRSVRPCSALSQCSAGAIAKARSRRITFGVTYKDRTREIKRWRGFARGIQVTPACGQARFLARKWEQLPPASSDCVLVGLPDDRLGPRKIIPFASQASRSTDRAETTRNHA